MEVVIGIDIGGTNFRIGAVDSEYNLYNFEKKYIEGMFDGDTINSLYQEIIKYTQKFGYNNVKAVTIGIPSIISKDKRTVYSTPNLKGFDDINIVEPLTKLLKTRVIIDRDVNFLLMNDMHNLGLNQSGITTGFYIGTGFGNSIMIDGKFLSGKNGVAGELGHIPLLGVEEKCSCGNYSCAETRCSGKRLVHLVKEYFPDTKVEDIFLKHTYNSIIVDYVKSLAIPIATEINILDPDNIVIAGGVVMMNGFPKEILLESIKYHVRKPYPYKTLNIIYTSHTQKSGVLGGARYAFQNN